MSISNVIALFGGVALFLFGMSLMGEGLKKVAGNQLETAEGATDMASLAVSVGAELVCTLQPEG